MAKTAKAQESSTALATTAPANDQMAALNAALDFDFEQTGLEEVDAEDLRFAIKVWNLRGKKKDASGDLHRVDEFLDTLTEKTQRVLNCVFVTLHKTNSYAYYDNEKKETVLVCSSYDRMNGKLRTVHPFTGQQEGLERPCDGCPDQDWYKDDKGKNKRNCSTVYGLIGVELDEDGGVGSPFMIRFKKTSLPAFKTYMQKHHIKRRKHPSTGRMVDVPLFAYSVNIKLEADEGGQYAVPVFSEPTILPDHVIRELAEQCRSFSEMATDVVKAAEKKESALDTEGESVGGAGGARSRNEFADDGTE